MTPKAKYALASIAILTAFAAGRWLAPEHVKTVKEIVTVKEKQKVKIVEKDVHRTTTITEYPDGHKETVIVDNSTQSSNSNSKSSTDQTSTTTTEISRGTSKVTLSALTGIGAVAGDNGGALSMHPLFGVSISKPILGPITLGAFAFPGNLYGGSLGLTF